MTDQTQPVRRVKRPELSKPATPAPNDVDAEEAAAIQAEARREEAAARAQAEEARAKVDELRKDPPKGAARAHVERDGKASPIGTFIARDGDVLVCSYPEVTLPLPKQYAMVKFGGLIFTRKLVEGDDVEEQARTIMAWLAAHAEAAGTAKYRRIYADFIKNDAAKAAKAAEGATE